MSLSLAVKTLSYAYGNTAALSDINFSIAAGECAILLGPNGAGKSTLFSLITHLYDSRSGEISINGFNVKTQACQALANLGVVFQQTTLDMDLSVLQNLYYHASLHGMSRKQASVRVSEELERQGMLARKDEKIRQLNGGHRRRVEIARALLHKPSLLLLDEPTVGLDVSSRKGIVEHVHALCNARCLQAESSTREAQLTALTQQQKFLTEHIDHEIYNCDSQTSEMTAV